MGTRPLARPALAPQDPLSAIVPGVVPERKRFCSGCDAQLKRDGGFCPKCGQEYSFSPSLNPGDQVAGKYEIKGTIAFGGLGWIYLALDTVLNRWVILKGLLNSKDPKMLAVAVQEREYLALVKHPNVVGIYDFVTHGDLGFIAMEYVNGKTLMTLRKEHGGPMPVAEAISYVVEILPALGYLDDMGLAYCDFKPDNVMVEEETVKLIDLGAVRQIDAVGGDIYGSKGYTAPEAHDAPTPLSDLYSAGRALAVLVASFDFQGKYETSLPPASECPVFQEHEALYRFLLKATREKPEERFQTAAEMSDQLVGVLQTILGAEGELGRIESTLFESESERVDSLRLPRLRVDTGDAGASLVHATFAMSEPSQRRKTLVRALESQPESVELKLRLADEIITMGDFAEAAALLAEVQGKNPSEWRAAWYRGRALLAQGKSEETVAAFEWIANELPGELAPRQALGRAYEQAGALERAASYFEAVSRADTTFTSAAFGLARCLEARSDKHGAAAAYRRVAPSSNRYPHAQMALARLLTAGADPSLEDVLGASAAIASLDGLMDGLEVHLLRAELFATAASVALTHKAPNKEVLGVPYRVLELRAAAETELRTCARFATSSNERIRFIDRANAVRPFTLV